MDIFHFCIKKQAPPGEGSACFVFMMIHIS